MNLVQIISLEVIYFLRAELHWNQHFRILKIGKRIELEQAKTLASGKYDSGRGTSGIKPTKPFKKIKGTFNSLVAENAAFVNKS